MMPASLFKQLLLPLYPRLQRVALRLLGNTEDAEDMVQEVYMKLWSKRDALPDVKEVEAYCVTMTKNMCIDRLRMAEVEKEDVDEVPIMLAATDDVEAQVALEDINLCYTYGQVDVIGQMKWLKRLWWSGSWTAKVRYGDALRENLPDCTFNFDTGSSTGEGWRKGKNYYAMRDLFGMSYMIW